MFLFFLIFLKIKIPPMSSGLIYHRSDIELYWRHNDVTSVLPIALFLLDPASCLGRVLISVCVVVCVGVSFFFQLCLYLEITRNGFLWNLVDVFRVRSDCLFVNLFSISTLTSLRNLYYCLWLFFDKDLYMYLYPQYITYKE